MMETAGPEKSLSSKFLRRLFLLKQSTALTKSDLLEELTVAWFVRSSEVPGCLDGVGSYTVGRHEAGDIVISVKFVSRRHLLVEVTGNGRRFSRDESSMNSVLIDGVPLNR